MQRAYEAIEQDFEELLEIAYLGLDCRLYDQAVTLLRTLEVAVPGNPHPRIGQALVRYARGDAPEAIRMLEAVLSAFPDAVFTRSLLAKLLKESGAGGWEVYAREALDRVDQGVAADLARSVLGGPVASNERASGSSQSEGAAIDVFRGRRA